MKTEYNTTITLTIEIPRKLIQEGNTIIIKVSDSPAGCTITSFQSNGTIDKQNIDNSQIRQHTSKDIPTVGGFIQKLSSQLNNSGNHRLAETYLSTMRSFMRFRNGQALPIGDLDSRIVCEYETYLRRQDLAPNTVSFYLKRLRTIYNKAVEAHSFTDTHPFARVSTKNAPTAKRALSVDEIRRIAVAQTDNEEEQMARDLFVFSYFARGMSFVDIAFLRKSDIRDGYLVYRRRKTGQQLKMAWHESMQHIADRLPSKDGVHLLSILDQRSDQHLRHQYHYRQCRLNQALKRLAQRIGIPKKVTMYCARHSWATIARNSNVPVSVISEALGHQSEKTTRIYLGSISADRMDGYSRQLIELIVC